MLNNVLNIIMQNLHLFHDLLFRPVQGRNVGVKSGGTNSGEDNVASLGT